MATRPVSYRPARDDRLINKRRNPVPLEERHETVAVLDAFAFDGWEWHTSRKQPQVEPAGNYLNYKKGTAL